MYYRMSIIIRTMITDILHETTEQDSHILYIIPTHVYCHTKGVLITGLYHRGWLHCVHITCARVHTVSLSENTTGTASRFHGS